jgi:hypothetical protein
VPQRESSCGIYRQTRTSNGQRKGTEYGGRLLSRYLGIAESIWGETLGIDVYAHPLPKKKGQWVIRGMNCELLVLKLEQGDEVKEKAIRRFLNLEEFGLTRSNVGEDKDNARRCRVFKDRLRLPTSYVEMMCDSVYMKHFYSEKEIGAIGSRWHGRRER